MLKLHQQIVISDECSGLQAHTDTSNPTDLSNQSLVAVESEQAEQELYHLAYQNGFNAACTQLQEQTTVLHQQLNGLIAAIPHAIAANRLELHSEIADVVLMIAKQLFIDQQHDKAQLEKQINHLLQQVNTKQCIELSLHPREIEAIQNGSIQLHTQHLHDLKIISDNNLNLGGCRIHSQHGLFDSSIEKQIDNLKELLVLIRKRTAHVLKS